MSNTATSAKDNVRTDEPPREAGANNSENPLDQGWGLFSAACARLGLDASTVQMGVATLGSDLELLEKELLALVGAEDA